MRWSRSCLRQLVHVRLQEKYKLVEYPKVPDPKFISNETFCECEYPADKQINHEKPLYGTKALNWKHALVHSDVEPQDWLSKVELMPTEIISTLSRFKRTAVDPMYPVMISNIHLEEPDISTVQGKKKILVYPDNKYYQIDETEVEEFMKERLNPNSTSSNFVGIPNLTRNLLICGHLHRDIRCGIIAPVLKKEFEFNLKERGMLFDKETNPTGVKIGIVSHIGGHAYAGNVLYFDEDGLSIWYGRVENKHVDAIISETIVNKSIIKELYRGRY